MTWSEFHRDYDLPPYVGPRRTYLIATTQRTGSHFLAHLLGARGVVGVPFEYLNRHRASLELQSRGEEINEQAHVTLLREMRERRTGSAGWFGVKAHCHTWLATLKNPELADQIQPEAFIHLRREDRIAQAASLALAEQTGWWVDESQTRAFSPIYSPAHIRKALETLEAEDEAWQAYFSQGRDRLVLTYEEVIANPEAAVSAVCTHLGVTDTGVPRRTFPSPRARPDGLVGQWAERFRRDVLVIGPAPAASAIG